MTKLTILNALLLSEEQDKSTQFLEVAVAFVAISISAQYLKKSVGSIVVLGNSPIRALLQIYVWALVAEVLYIHTIPQRLKFNSV